MSKLLKQLDPKLASGATRVVTTLQEAGYEALLAGGVVRDLLLERPVSDVDIATSAPPNVVEQLFPRTIPLGRQFGVVIVATEAFNFEVTTFRKEAGYVDGRRPTSISFTDVRQDARRRDFTINALFLKLDTEEVIDFVDGRKDLEEKRIRTVGEAKERFREDKLRLLRAVRLACDLDFQIEEACFEQLRLQSATVDRVAKERVREELAKLLTGPAAARGLEILHETGLLKVILPEVEAMAGVEQPPEYHPEGDVFTHTKLMFEAATGPSLTLALGILLHDVGKPPTFTVRERIRFDGHADVGAEMAEAICRRLRFPNRIVESVVDLVKGHLRFIHVQEMRESTLKRLLRKPNFAEHLELHRLDCLASHGNLEQYEFCKQKQKEFSHEKMRPEPLVTGEDLIEMGLTPGPVFGEILRRLEDRQLEGEISSRKEALEWVSKEFC